MPGKETHVNPLVLQWARETSGLTIEEVARKLRLSSSTVLGWESGHHAPTYIQLETLAYKVYKRPIAVFFFPEPPEEKELEEEFRLLPSSKPTDIKADTRFQLRIAKSMQLSLIELNYGHNPCKRTIFHDVKIDIHNPILQQAQVIRNYIGVKLETQVAWKNTDVALKKWRQAVESVGVYVFKNAFKQKDVSGFCLNDDQFPIIYLNNSNSKNRQIFSIFHELSHILLNVNAMCKINSELDAFVPDHYRHVEQFCNALAAEILMPTDDFDDQITQLNSQPNDVINMLTKRYKVSPETVLRRLLEKKRITQSEYQQKIKHFTKYRKDSGQGGNYYAMKTAYLGENYIKLVLSRYYQGKIDIYQVTNYLNVKTKHISDLESFVFRERALT